MSELVNPLFPPQVENGVFQMRIIFAGTSGFAVPVLEALIKAGRHTLIGVITQPDQISGRGLKKTASPVKETAVAHHLNLFQPASINEPAFQETLSGLAPEIMVVAAYGQKLSQEVISLPRHGCINIHPSLLPKYRGSAPINYALWNGETETGVTIFKIVEKMDAGPMLAQQKLVIEPEETAEQLGMRLARLGAELLMETLTRLEQGEVKLTPQDESKVTYAPRLKKSDGLIDWRLEALRIKNLVRAMQPWPGAYTFHRSPKPDSPASPKAFGGSAGRRDALKIDLVKVEIINSVSSSNSLPGMVEEITNDAIIVRTGRESLAIKELKPAGHRVMTARDFVNGYRIKKGDHFGADR